VELGGGTVDAAVLCEWRLVDTGQPSILPPRRCLGRFSVKLAACRIEAYCMTVDSYTTVSPPRMLIPPYHDRTDRQPAFDLLSHSLPTCMLRPAGHGQPRGKQASRMPTTGSETANTKTG
jgi:hypothetical protein